MEIPIIGQPKIDDWFITLQVKCTCGETFMMVGKPGIMRPCLGKDCDKLYRLNNFRHTASDGLQVALASATVPKDATPPDTATEPEQIRLENDR